MKKTVFVIGAGASNEANLPTGTDLKSKIAELLNIQYKNGVKRISGDPVIAKAFNLQTKIDSEKNPQAEDYVKSAWSICKALPLSSSIDNLIDNHRDNPKIEFCGKIAILKSILDAEKYSKLYVGPDLKKKDFDFNKIENTWYVKFFKKITEGYTADELSMRFFNIKIITFNYDRCIEQFLLLALIVLYGLDEERSAEILTALEIFHIYGSVGSLPWQKSNEKMEYGELPLPQHLLDTVHRIKTFTESRNPDSSRMDNIKSHIETADYLIFLGFGFNPRNLELITPQKPAKLSDSTCVGTSKGIYEEDLKNVRNSVSSFIKADYLPSLINCSCAEFFDRYWHNLKI